MKFLGSLDYMSQEVKIHTVKTNQTRYKTPFGGLLTVITFGLSGALSVYMLMALLIPTNPKAYQVTRHEDDVTKILFDNDNLFFALTVNSPKQASSAINETFIHLYGFLGTVKTGKILHEYGFSRCSYAVDFAGVESLFPNQDQMEKNYFCLSYMLLNGTRIPKTDPRFVIPYTEHGMSSTSQDPVYFQVGGRRCVNSTENNNSCLPKEVMDQYLYNSYYQMQFLDNYFDALDYDSPRTKFVEQITGSLGPAQEASNYVNFNNVEFVTHDGWLFDRSTMIESYAFQDRVEIVTSIIGGSNDNELFFFRLEGQNSLIHYERTYITLQEILANIGGLIKVLFLAAKFLLVFYNRMAIKQDLLVLVFSKFISFNQMKNKMKEKVAPLSHIGQISSTRKLFEQRVEVQAKAKNLNCLAFYWRKLKNLFSKDDAIDKLDKVMRLQKKIMNEFTIYKLYFEMQKLKSILLDENQRTAFEVIKLDYGSLEKEARFIDFKSLKSKVAVNMSAMSMSENRDKVDDSIMRMLKKTTERT